MLLAVRICQLVSVLLLVLVTWPAQGQRSAQVDSLYRALKTAQTDSVRAEIYLAICDNPSISETDTIIWAAQKVVAIANQNLAFATGSSKTFYLASKALAQQNLCYAYYFQGNMPQAMHHVRQSLALHQQLKDTAGLSEGYNYLSGIYAQSGDTAKAISYLQTSLRYSEASGHKENLASTLNNLAIMLMAQHNYTPALAYLKRALSISDARDPFSLAVAYSNLGYIYLQTGNRPLAQQNLQKSYELEKAAGNKAGMAMAIYNMAILAEADGNITQALTLARQSLELAKVANHTERIIDSELIMSRLYKQKADYRNALLHYEAYTKHRDQLNNQKAKKALLQQQLQYEFDKKGALARADQERRKLLAEQEEQKALALKIGAMLVALALMLFILKRALPPLTEPAAPSPKNQKAA